MSRTKSNHKETAQTNGKNRVSEQAPQEPVVVRKLLPHEKEFALEQYTALAKATQVANNEMKRWNQIQSLITGNKPNHKVDVGLGAVVDMTKKDATDAGVEAGATQEE